MKNVQWLTEVELVAEAYKGHYQKQGWSNDATVKTTSRIDLPGHGATLRGRDYLVRGLAFAGTRGIQQVEISTDEGAHWAQASLAEPLSPYAWRFWSFRWRIPGPDRNTLLVRATDGTGLRQASDEQDAYPDGATGLHEVTVTVGYEERVITVRPLPLSRRRRGRRCVWQHP